jgi:hypothetical protein
VARMINGALYCPSFDATANPGEFNVMDAIYDCQTDATGNGAYDIQIGFLLYVSAMDQNSGYPYPGVFHRYRITDILPQSATKLSCTIMWDEIDEPYDLPIPTTWASICSSSDQRNFGMIPPTAIYYNLPAGADINAMVTDIRSITDFTSFLKKKVKNMTGIAIPAYSVLCWLDDGTIGLAKADVIVKSDIAGININPIPNGEWGWIIKTGYIPNALTGLNAIPGATVYLSEESGRMTLTAPSSYSDSIIKIGRAEPPSGVVSAVANDLHMELEILAEP